jgi:hypothetical protein
VVSWLGASQRGLALGLRHMSTPLGGAIAAALLPLAADAGGVAAAAGLRRAEPEPGELDEPPPHVTSAGPLRDRAIWRLSLGTAAVVLGQISALSFLASYLHEQRGWSVTASALALAAVQIGGAVARVVAGAWSDRLGSRIRPLRAIALAGGLTLGAATALLPTPDGLAVPLLIVAGIVVMAGNGVSFAAAAEMVAPSRVGTALGLQNTIRRGRRPPVVAGRLRPRLAVPAGRLARARSARGRGGPPLGRLGRPRRAVAAEAEGPHRAVCRDRGEHEHDERDQPAQADRGEEDQHLTQPLCSRRSDPSSPGWPPRAGRPPPACA